MLRNLRTTLVIELDIACVLTPVLFSKWLVFIHRLLNGPLLFMLVEAKFLYPYVGKFFRKGGDRNSRSCTATTVHAAQDSAFFLLPHVVFFFLRGCGCY